MKKEIIVYSISDSLGGTSQKLLSAVTAQYPDIIFNNSYRFPFINKEEELLDILRDAIKDDALVISTLVDGKLAAVAREFSQANGLAYLDLMHPFFEIIKEKTGTSPIEVPGTLHRLDTEYFNIQIWCSWASPVHPKHHSVFIWLIKATRFLTCL